ncbi:uncharacterized protein [Musca autumnalis]|uniref:uncharacterized protein n=1 Tax=Musca autumnalis TaxID=221902 RepID=UPI003CE9B3F3
MQDESAQKLTYAHSRESSYKRHIGRLEDEIALLKGNKSKTSMDYENANILEETAVTLPVQQTVDTPPVPRIKILGASRAPSKMTTKKDVTVASGDTQQPISSTIPAGNNTEGMEAAATSSSTTTKKKKKPRRKVTITTTNDQMDTSPENVVPIKDAPSKAPGKNGKSIPFISTFNVNVKIMRRDIISVLGHESFKISVVNDKRAYFHFASLEEHGKIRALFVEKRVEFYTCSPKDQSPHSIIMSRLTSTYDRADVEEALSKLDLNLDIKNVARLGNQKFLINLGEFRY